jgi:hypothetical protein
MALRPPIRHESQSQNHQNTVILSERSESKDLHLALREADFQQSH